jgi:hypothetical protein
VGCFAKQEWETRGFNEISSGAAHEGFRQTKAANRVGLGRGSIVKLMGDSLTGTAAIFFVFRHVECKP